MTPFPSIKHIRTSVYYDQRSMLSTWVTSLSGQTPLFHFAAAEQWQSLLRLQDKSGERAIVIADTDIPEVAHALELYAMRKVKFARHLSLIVFTRNYRLNTEIRAILMGASGFWSAETASESRLFALGQIRDGTCYFSAEAIAGAMQQHRRKIAV